MTIRWCSPKAFTTHNLAKNERSHLGINYPAVTNATIDVEKIFLLPFLFLLLPGCLPPAERNPTEVPYVRTAFALLDEHLINAEGINLDSLEIQLLSRIDERTPRDTTHALLRAAVRTVNRHSDLFPPREFSKRVSTPDWSPARGRVIYEDIAYLYVPRCPAIDSLNAKAYTDTLQSLLKELYATDPAGWIIDLRDNTGGNMFAMIAGLGPLFPEGNLGYEMGRTDTPWYFKKTQASGEVDVLQLADSDAEFERKLPIAVLINQETASAAEALAISLKCHPQSILLGTKTYGLATGNEMFFLPDSACLNLTTSVMADCQRVKYPDGLAPDVEIKAALELFEYAVDWIHQSKH